MKAVRARAPANDGPLAADELDAVSCMEEKGKTHPIVPGCRSGRMQAEQTLRIPAYHRGRLSMFMGNPTGVCAHHTPRAQRLSVNPSGERMLGSCNKPSC